MRPDGLSAGRLLPAACLVAALAAPAPASATTERQVKSSLRSIVRSMPGSTSVYVREHATLTVLASRNSTTKRIPASVTKLFTTSTALMLDGPENRLPTELRMTGEIDGDGVLRGDLIVRGSGNPGLRLDQIDTLARAADRAGIERIAGKLRADLGGWTRQQGTPLTRGSYNREIGGRLGSLVTLRGFASGSVTDPASQVLVRLREALRSRGLRGSVSLATSRSTKDADSELLTTVNSPTLAALATSTNAPSDNFYAEMLLRGVGGRHGRAGTTTEGLKVEAAALRELGVRAQLADGSGLSRGNRVSPTTIVRLLDQMAARPEGAALRSSLALAGSTGTLAGRMRGTAAAGRCRAKTGTLSNVSALAGWCTTVGKRTVAFAILNNKVSPGTARRYQDRVAATIAAWSDRAIVPDEPVKTTPLAPTTPAGTTPTGGGAIAP